MYRHEAWNEGHLNNTNADEYGADTPAAYAVDAMDISGFLARKMDPLHWYRHESWNEANHNATHIAEYNGDTPPAYLVAPNFLAKS